MTNELINYNNITSQHETYTYTFTIYCLMRVASRLVRLPLSSRLTVVQPSVVAFGVGGSFQVAAARMASISTTAAAAQQPTKSGSAKPLINLLRGMHLAILTQDPTHTNPQAGQTHPSFLPNSCRAQQTMYCRIALSQSQASNTVQIGEISSFENPSQNGWPSSILRL